MTRASSSTPRRPPSPARSDSFRPTASRWFYPVVHHTALTVWRHSFPVLPGAASHGQWALSAANDTGHLAPGEFLDYTA